MELPDGVALAYDGLVDTAHGVGLIDRIFADHDVVLLRLFSRLPFGVLHAISGLVARLASGGQLPAPGDSGNIERSFPERSGQSIGKLNACITGISRTLRWSPSRTSFRRGSSSRMEHEHVDVFEPFFQAGRSVLIAGGHFNNWELYAMTANQNVPHDVMAVYKRLTNSTMDEAVRESRQRFGLEMVRTVDSQAWMDAHQRRASQSGGHGI